MKLCDTCIYRNNVELLKPCIVYRDDCEFYESEEDMSEVGVEIVKTEEAKESGIKYLNINVSNSEVERNPDIVRLCADAGILEYVKPKTGHWSRKIKVDAYDIAGVKTWGIKCQCDRCDFTTIVVEDFGYYKYCPNCGCRMVEPQESEE